MSFQSQRNNTLNNIIVPKFDQTLEMKISFASVTTHYLPVPLNTYINDTNDLEVAMFEQYMRFFNVISHTSLHNHNLRSLS